METRIRVRSVPPPVARVRTRVLPVVVHRVAPYAVPDELSRERCCGLGEVDKTLDPAKWLGWPNGSLVMGRVGRLRIHRGRMLRTESGGYHVLRWNGQDGAYRYVGRWATHERAFASL